MNFSLLGVCLDRKQFRRGSHEAPHELRNAFLNIETFLDGIDLQDHWLKDLGNIIPNSYDDLEKQIKAR